MMLRDATALAICYAIPLYLLLLRPRRPQPAPPPPPPPPPRRRRRQGQPAFLDEIRQAVHVNLATAGLIFFAKVGFFIWLVWLR